MCSQTQDFRTEKLFLVVVSGRTLAQLLCLSDIRSADRLDTDYLKVLTTNTLEIEQSRTKKLYPCHPCHIGITNVTESACFKSMYIPLKETPGR